MQRTKPSSHCEPGQVSIGDLKSPAHVGTPIAEAKISYVHRGEKRHARDSPVDEDDGKEEDEGLCVEHKR